MELVVGVHSGTLHKKRDILLLIQVAQVSNLLAVSGSLPVSKLVRLHAIGDDRHLHALCRIGPPAYEQVHDVLCDKNEMIDVVPVNIRWHVSECLIGMQPTNNWNIPLANADIDQVLVGPLDPHEISPMLPTSLQCLPDRHMMCLYYHSRQILGEASKVIEDQEVLMVIF